MNETEQNAVELFGELRPYLDDRDRRLIEVTIALATGHAEMGLAEPISGIDPVELIALAEHVIAVRGTASEGELKALCQNRIAHGEASIENRIALDDHDTTLIDRGSGATPIVLIHSLGLDWRMSRDILPELAEHARVITYDLRLHGVANTVEPETFTLERCADDLDLLLDKLGVDRAHVVGFSLGGAVAQVFALRHPSRLAALGLVCTMAVSDGSTYLNRAEAAETFGMDAQIRPTMRRWFNASTLAENHWAVRYAREKVRSVPTAHWAQYWRALSDIDTLDALHQVDAPTTVIAAEHDRSTPPAGMQRIAESIPHATFHVVAGAAHMIGLQAPHEVAQLILASQLPDTTRP
jgi:3-oxoadipate enol-lactonase